MGLIYFHIHSVITDANVLLAHDPEELAGVFQAFKEVEVAVRDAGGFSLTDIGVELMREAFKANVGPLTDTNVPVPEQLATGNLFAGAIGSYKNPGSHRNVSLVDPTEAIELIFMASHLLRIVDSRAKPSSGVVSTP